MLRFAKNSWISIIVSCGFLLSGIAEESQKELTKENQIQRPRIGLVLSGGGARGAAHVGVIKRLEELNIPIDAIAGTSMGAVVGGVYASGVSIEEIEDWLITANWRSLLNDQPDRSKRSMRTKEEEFNYPRGMEFGVEGFSLRGRPSLIAGQKLILELRKLTLHAQNIKDFDQLPIPFKAIATDILTGDEVVLEQGNLPLAIRASMAIPGLFAPVKMDGMVLVDGFLTNNLPINLAKQMGVDIVIAVDVKGELLKEDQLNSPVAYTTQMLSVMGQLQDKKQLTLLEEKDIYLHILMPGQSPADFPSSAQNIKPGYQKAKEYDQRLSQLSIPSQDYRVWNQSRQLKTSQHVVIDEIKIADDTRVSEKSIRNRLGLKEGQPVSVQTLEAGLERIFDMGAFELVDFSIEEGLPGDGDILNVIPKDKTWGPNYLKFGFALSSNLESESAFDFLFKYRMTQLNSLGGELNIEAIIGTGQDYDISFYQPLDSMGRFFIEPEVSYTRTSVSGLIGEGSQLISANGFSYGATAGMNLGSQAVLSFKTGHNDIKIKGLLPGPLNIYEQAYAMEFRFDSLDSAYFPKDGMSLHLRMDKSVGDVPELDSIVDQEGYSAQLIYPLTFGRSTVLTAVQVSGIINREGISEFLPSYSTGGFLNLSGATAESISGNSLFLGRLIFYHRLADFAPLMGEGVYIGGSIEAGNAWQDNSYHADDLIYAGSLFIGIDSLIGPLYFGYGQTSSKDSSFYFHLGQNF